MNTFYYLSQRPLSMVLFLLGFFLHSQAANWTVTSGADSGPGSLRHIIVNQAQSGDNIYFSSGVASSGITFSGNQIVVNKSLFVSGLSVGSVTITGSTLNNRMFLIQPLGSILFENVNFKGMYFVNPPGPQNTAVDGGVFYNQGTLILRDCDVLDCGIRVWKSPPSANGGVIYNTAVLALIRCEFTDSRIYIVDTTNSNTTLNGGNIYNSSTGAAQMQDCVFKNASAEGRKNTRGGAIYNAHDMALYRCAFRDCRVKQIENHIQLQGNAFRGGAIHSETGFTLNDCSFSKCSARAENSIASGGAIYAMSTLAMTGCLVEKCVSYSSFSQSAGGGIAGFSNLSLLNTRVIDNTSDGKDNQTGYAGGVYHDAGILTLENCTVSGNRCITHHVSGTTASYGGGIASRGSTMKVLRSTFSGNLVSRPRGAAEGGGIYFNGNQFECNNSTFSGNSAISGNPTGNPDQNTHNAVGGGLSVTSSQFKMIHCTIAENTIGAQTSFSNIQRGSGLKIFVSGPSTFYNNIVGQNHTLNLSIHPNVDIFGTLISNGYNLVETLDLLQTIVPAPTDIVLASPNLLPLANYGGPTETHALSCGSLPRNNGTNLGILATDQRGMPRIIGTSTDIGAFEATDLESVTVPAPDMVCFGSCVLLAASDPNLVTYTWVVQSGGAVIHGSGAQVCVTLTSQATILLTATDSYGCTVYVTINIDVDSSCEADPTQLSCCSGGGEDKAQMAPVDNEPFFSVFPNPSGGSFSVKGMLASDAQEALAEVFTADGRLLVTQVMSLEAGAFESIVDLSAQADGLYFVKVSAGGASHSERVLIQR